jgi:hypothetical protein
MAPQAHRRTRPDPSGRYFPAVFQGLAITRELQPNGLHPFQVGDGAVWTGADGGTGRGDTLPARDSGHVPQRGDEESGDCRRRIGDEVVPGIRGRGRPARSALGRGEDSDGTAQEISGEASRANRPGSCQALYPGGAPPHRPSRTLASPEKGNRRWPRRENHRRSQGKLRRRVECRPPRRAFP